MCLEEEKLRNIILLYIYVTKERRKWKRMPWLGFTFRNSGPPRNQSLHKHSSAHTLLTVIVCPRFTSQLSLFRNYSIHLHGIDIEDP